MRDSQRVLLNWMEYVLSRQLEAAETEPERMLCRESILLIQQLREGEVN